VILIGYSNGANIASSLLLLRPEIMSSAVLFRVMVPFIPEKVPNLTTKNIFMGAGEHDPIVPKKQTEMLYHMYKEAGAKVLLHWEENSGHELGHDEISVTKDWLLQLPIKKP
jgi:phospholipase/carboxylesterase